MLLHFRETKGEGLEAVVEGQHVRLGNAGFLGLSQIPKESGQVLVEINGVYRGRFSVKSKFRKGWETVLQKLGVAYVLALISGDNSRDRGIVAPYFKEGNMHFSLKPQDKLDFIKKNQAAG
ncbi:MAG: ATPase, partial [Leadbetterella sp.]|nr:ATPase [Leadbetterella sp.]